MNVENVQKPPGAMDWLCKRRAAPAVIREGTEMKVTVSPEQWTGSRPSARFRARKRVGFIALTLTPVSNIVYTCFQSPIGTFIYLEINCVLDYKLAFPKRGT